MRFSTVTIPATTNTAPKNQNDKSQEWLEAQQDILLPVPYFMLAFTLPAALCEVVRSNQNLLYSLLFRISAATTQHLAKDPRFIGSQIDLVGILHTRGRNLAYHPGIHYLVQAGGLTTNTQTWLPQTPGFFTPIARTEVPGGLRGGRSCSRAGQSNPRSKAPLPKLWPADAFSACYSAYRVLPTMSIFSLSPPTYH
jgi:hypothetical protein